VLLLSFKTLLNLIELSTDCSVFLLTECTRLDFYDISSLLKSKSKFFNVALFII